LAVIGAGTVGRRHLQAIAAEPSARAVAVVDPAPAGELAADEWRLPHFTDVEAMLDEVAPEGAIIATPNSLHVALSLACVNVGVPVLVEKPIADTLDAALTLADASEAAGVPVLVGHHRRHNPIVRKARDLVRSGALGRLTAVSATWLVHKPDEYFDVAWRRETGGGPILINLIHDIDSLRFIVGDISKVQSMTSSGRRGFAVEDTAAVLLRFSEGVLATVMMSDAVAAPWSWELTSGERTSYVYPQSGQDCYFFAGTEASIALPSLRLWRHDGSQSWQSPLLEERLAVDEGDPVGLQLRHFADVIHGIADPLITARDAARTLEAALAVAEAAATSGEIVLSSYTSSW
jgi:predicted dehydrogenase